MTCKVTYTVKNLTTKQVPLTFTDGAGGTKTETGGVPIPIVGTVVFDLPKNFTDVNSVAASMGGDGHGGTQMEYLLTLFPPIGSDTVSFGYTAHLTDGLLPPVSFTAVPVDPTTNPTFATAVDSYASGAKTGDKLAAGATKINTNLLRLRDGAGQLLDGLIKLDNGAHQLDAGLAGQAAPGAAKLADGAQQADVGGQKLAAGLTKLHDALSTLPQTLQHNHKYQLLLGALTQIAQGVGNLNDSPTKKSLLGGLNAIQQGLEVGSLQRLHRLGERGHPEALRCDRRGQDAGPVGGPQPEPESHPTGRGPADRRQRGIPPCPARRHPGHDGLPVRHRVQDEGRTARRPPGPTAATTSSWLCCRRA